MKKFDTHLTKITFLIDEMIENSEKIYGFISDQLPILEQQAEIAIHESKALLEKFQDSNSDNDECLMGLVSDLDDEMKDIYESLNSQKEITKLLNEMALDQNESVNFNTLLKVIDDLTKIFSDLKQLSINAIIFSSRLEHGEAFRVISQEINQLSMKIEEDYVIFEDNLIILKKWNNEFINQLENLTTIEKEIFSQYETSLMVAMKDTMESLEGICLLIKDFISQVEKSLNPIENIIMALQGQDLIRQNMENFNEIIFTLESSIEKYNEEDLTVEEALNTLEFVIDISKLSKNLVNNVDEQFQVSIDEILTQAMVMDDILQVINSDGKTLWEFMVSGIQKGEIVSSSIDKKNERVIKEVTLFEKKMDKIITGYTELDVSDTILNKYLTELETNFNQISLMANRFNRIKVLAKIEFARLSQKDNAHIKNIEKVIDLFINFTKKNQNIFYGIEKNIVADIQSFSILREKITADLKDASKTIKLSKVELKEVKVQIKDTIKGLIEITTALYEDVHKIINEFKAFGDLSNSIHAIDEVLDELMMEAITKKESILKENNLSDWQSTNDYYEAIEEKFTSYIERKTANETFALEAVDEGAEGGELTLF